MILSKYSKIFWLLLCLLFCICFTSVPLFTRASFAQDIRLSEIHPTAEYIEIENVSEKSIDLSNWKYSEIRGSREVIYPIEKAPTEFSAGAFFVIELKRKINDTGDTVGLYNSTDEKIDDVIIPKKKIGKSWSRIQNTWQWAEPTQGIKNTATPTPTPSSSPTPSITPSSTPVSTPTSTPLPVITPSPSPSPVPVFLPLKISEILPNPSGTDAENEFIELYNPNEETISLENWILEDASGKQFVFDNHYSIEGKKYIAYFRPLTKITLNNTAETVVLKNPNQEIISQLTFSTAATENYSYTSQGWTNHPSPHLANVTSLPSTNTNNISHDNSWLFSERFFSLKTRRIQSPKLLITKISANSKRDFIEVMCIKCDMDLEGIRLGIDGEAYRIPEKIFGKTGDVLRFQFKKNTISTPKKYSKGWVFFIPLSGLTTTDESIYIGDEKGKILDGICYANMNNSFTSKEQDDLGNLIYTKAWETKHRGEAGCIDVSVWGRNKILTRIKQNTLLQDTNTAKDFFLSNNTHYSFLKSEKEVEVENKQNIQIQKISINKNNTIITLQNTSKNFIDISQFFIANKNKFLTPLSDKKTLLAPHNTVTITLPQKKLPRRDFAFSIRNTQNKIFDSFCMNHSKYAKKYATRYTHFQKWKGNCLQWHHTKNTHTVFTRKDFLIPSSINNYEHRLVPNINEPLEINLHQSPTEISPPEKSEIWQKERKRDLKKHNLSIIPHQSYLEITGQIKDRPKYIILSIPKAGIKKRIKLSKTGKFKKLFFQKFKKGNYIMVISYKKQNAEKKGKKGKKNKRIRMRERFLLPHHIFPNELQNITFSKILPNPKGKDSKKEQVILQNISGKSGWIRGWKINQGRKTMKKLPTLFLEAGEVVTLEPKYFSALKNSSGFIAIENSAHHTIDKISWKKAREGEYFGKNAPRFTPPKKKKKKAKKGSSKKKKSESKKKSEKKQIITNEILIITNIHNNEFTLYNPLTQNEYFYVFPEKTKFLYQYFSIGDEVNAQVSEKIVLEIQLHQSQILHNTANNNGDKKNISSLRIFLLIVTFLLGMGSVWWWRKITPTQ